MHAIYYRPRSEFVVPLICFLDNVSVIRTEYVDVWHDRNKLRNVRRKWLPSMNVLLINTHGKR